MFVHNSVIEVREDGGAMEMAPTAVWIRLGVGVAGGALALSGFLPWSESGGDEATGWEVASGPATLALLAGFAAIAAAATGGRIGPFPPPVSLPGGAHGPGGGGPGGPPCGVLFRLPGP